MRKYSVDAHRFHHSFRLVVTLFFLLCFLVQNVAGSVSYSLLMEPYTTVTAPLVILEDGNAGNCTIYTNSTSARVNVTAPLFDYVDNNEPDVDSSADEGTHSNFSAQQAGPDSIYDTLKEENTEGIEDYVDNNISDMDSSPDNGTHSNFENQKAQDSSYDTLTEENTGGASNTTLIDAESFEGTWPPTGWTETGSWNREDQQAYDGTWSADFDGQDPGQSGDLDTPDLDCSDALAIYVSFYFREECSVDNEFSLRFWDGSTWDNIEDLGQGYSPGWNLWEMKVTDSQYFKSDFKVRWRANDVEDNEHIYVDLVTVKKEIPSADNYELDLEVQFTSVIDFLPTEKLCIYTGTLGDEDLRVDFWNGTGWENLATDLTAYSCSEHAVSLTSANFTIRFKAGTESTDTTQDQWQIDASLLRVEGAGSKEDAVDQESNVDGPGDVGTHSNFTAQQYGPDSVYDTLTEGNTGGSSNSTLLDDGFEAADWDANWDDIPHDWEEDDSPVHSGSASARARDFNEGFFTCDDLDASGASAIYVDFWFRKRNTESTDFTLYYYDGSNYDFIDELDDNGGDNTWLHYVEKVTDNQYFVSNFRIRFDATLEGGGPGGEEVHVDDVLIKKETQTADNYQLDLEVQWTNVIYLLPNEVLCIKTGDGSWGAEDIEVYAWNASDSSWDLLASDLNASSWNNITITDYLTSNSFTVRFLGGSESSDTNQDLWQIDVGLVHVWNEAGGESYELDLEVQWTSADYTQTNEELCIKTGTFSGSENIQVKVWNNTGGSWDWVMNLTASQWNNKSITSHLTSSTLTVQYLGGAEMGDTSEDSWNIDAALLHVWTNVQAPTGWLSGWDKRVKITIDNNDVDSALSNFPVLVNLSSSSGRNNDDVSCVFDEVGSNSKKIAVTTSNGTTECYVEIEKWDSSSEQAWLWVKVPSVSNTSNTDLYLYYDNDHANNTAYVDDTNTGNSVNIWDSSFKMVQHMRDNTTSSIVDSTSNDNDGTKTAAGEPAVTTSGKISDAQDFDGSNDYIDLPDGFVQNADDFTFVAWVYWDGPPTSDWERIFDFGTGTTVNMFLTPNNGATNDPRFAITTSGTGGEQQITGPSALSTGTWHHIAVTIDDATTTGILYINGVNVASNTGMTLSPSDLGNTDQNWFGRSQYGADPYFDGIIDEARISNTSRSAAWIKASYESGRDDLLGFGSEETCGRAEKYDYVLRVNNTDTDSRQVRLKKYSDSNINRLRNCTIYFHNSTNGVSGQIYIENGDYTQDGDVGPWYNLPSSTTIYIAMTVEADSTGTSYVHTYLEILIPNTTVYAQYIITFEIT